MLGYINGVDNIKVGIICSICGGTIELRHPCEKRMPICDDCLRTLRKVIEREKERDGGVSMGKIKKPHGRLIDADELIRSLEVDPFECPGCPEPEYIGEIIELLREAPTIVEAEDEE